MTAAFPFEEYETQTSESSFPFEQYEKKQEPVTAKGAVSQFGVGVAGGAGGIGGDIAPFFGIVGTILPKLGFKTTPEQTEAVAKQAGLEDPQNALERILRTSGEFGGQEAILGTAGGGPIGGALGLAHGSASGMLYGGLKETGLPEEWALGVTALATLSPIAFQKLLPTLMEKFKKGSNFTEAIESLAPKTPPPAPEKTYPFLRKELPTGRREFETAEQALEELRGAQPKPEIPGPQFKVEFEEMPKKEFQKSLKGRAKILDETVPNVITKEKFYNEKHGGTNISKNLKNDLEIENKEVRKKYDLAEKTTKGQADIFPKLAKKTDDMLLSLKETGKPSTGEEAVIKQLEALQKMIGYHDTPLEVPLSRLIKTADSMSQLVNYEIAGGGPKKLLAGFVKDMNEAVATSLEAKGLSAKAIKEADASYAKMADKFYNDEISPFMERKIRNPEANYRKAVSDEGTYRAIQQALGKTAPKSIEKLERDIVESRIRPYVKDIEKIGSEEFKKEMANLEGLIGKEKAKEVKNRLLKEKEKPRPKPLEKPKKIHKEKITSSTVQKVSKTLEKSPSELMKMMDSREGIRELKKELQKAKIPKTFDNLAEVKTENILRKGEAKAKKLTVDEIFNEINKVGNYEVLSELYGKETVNAALDDLSRAIERGEKERATAAMFKELAKMGAKVAGASKLLKALEVVLKAI